MPENAIVVDEGSNNRARILSRRRTPLPAPHTCSGQYGRVDRHWAAHGGRGGNRMSGAGKVVSLEADGSGMYTLQALWTHAREQLDILTIVFANRGYQILRDELRNVGATAGGPRAEALMDLGRPDIDWVSLARTFGVEAFRAGTADELSRHMRAGLAVQGPCLIEVAL